MAMRSDMACGSTIGPITSTVLGVDTVDARLQLGMHSIRETTGWHDPVLLYRALKEFLNPKRCNPSMPSQRKEKSRAPSPAFYITRSDLPERQYSALRYCDCSTM